MTNEETAEVLGVSIYWLADEAVSCAMGDLEADSAPYAGTLFNETQEAVMRVVRAVSAETLDVLSSAASVAYEEQMLQSPGNSLRALLAATSVATLCAVEEMSESLHNAAHEAVKQLTTPLDPQDLQ